MIVVAKEGLTSKDLISHARELEYLKERIVNKAETFTNVREPFDVNTFADKFENTVTYTLESATELDALTQQVEEELSKQEATAKQVVVRVKQQVHTADIDVIVKRVEESAVKSERKVLMILTGTEGTASSTQDLISLQQAGARILAETSVDTSATIKLKDGPVPGIQYYLTPNSLTGLMVSAFILFVLIFVMLQLFYVQTPSVFVDQSIDFGKIEK
jgi:hypothetical protein